MKNIKYILLFLTVLTITSCYKEDPIVPVSTEGADRFSFPQGNSPHDNVVNDVFKKFGVKIIYKDFRNEDFNLSWTAAAVGKEGYDIPEAEQSEATRFIANHIFGFLHPDITKRVLPPYFYVADSIFQMSSLAGGLLVSKQAQTYIYNGLDFWAFCWNGCQPWQDMMGNVTYLAITGKPSTPFEKFYRRGVMLKEIFKKAADLGNIGVPEDFSSGLDFTTAIKYATGTENDPNYFKKRGFPGQMISNTNFNITNLTSITRTSPSQVFTDYIHLCMRYTADSIEVLYPKAKYPIIHQKYPIAIEYIKGKFGIDLVEIATKPTE
ncbi:hypothetical protein SDC9_73470 [bioreactor metagenome]|uniref:Uncharacterized protein n=1 Tax=bioreactor metagenome TaxID=1076179 RepID=A0A644YEH8_9ZZZZ|nr:hypothetical protein [Rikenellaceae bacterium]